MDFNVYAFEILVRYRLESLRADAARHILAPPSNVRISLRERLGRTLIRLGNRLVATAPRPAADSGPR